MALWPDSDYMPPIAVGVPICPDTAWIIHAYIKLRKNSSIPIVYASPDEPLYNDCVISDGGAGTIYRYRGKSPHRKQCALKVMEQPIFRGELGNHTFLEAAISSKGCPIAFTLFIEAKHHNGTPVCIQIMELGNGDATVCARKKSATPHDFLRFCITACATLLKHGLANTDAKINNIMFVDKPSCTKNAEFRIIDVDGITACALEPNLQAHAAKYNTVFPDVLFIEYSIATFPIINYKDIACPILMAIQTWYAHLVASLHYYAIYTDDHKLYKDAGDRLIYTAMATYEYKTLGIFSKSHPFYLIVEAYPNLPPVYAAAAVDLLRLGSIDNTHLVTNCHDLKKPELSQATDPSYLEKYTAYATVFHSIVSTITAYADAFILPPPPPPSRTMYTATRRASTRRSTRAPP
jgi:hypothetical protein